MTVKLDYSFYTDLPLSKPYGEVQLQNPTFGVISAIREAGSIGKAAERLGLSYRYLWGVLKKLEVDLGQSLIAGGQGQSARLSDFGERLFWAEKRIQARLLPHAESLAVRLDRELQLAIDPDLQPIAVCASHDLLFGALRDRLCRASQLLLDIEYMGSSAALERLNAGSCQIAGIHLPIWNEGLCRRGSIIHAGIGRQMKLGEHKLIRFARRDQGLMVRTGNPASIGALGDLARPSVVFVNRTAGSGTRLLFDELLQQAGVAPESIDGYHDEEPTHLSVAASVAAGLATCGFGLRAAADRFGLQFIPLLTEQYFVVCRKASLDSAVLQALIRVLESENFRKLIDAVPGYSSMGAGEIISLRGTLPWYK